MVTRRRVGLAIAAASAATPVAARDLVQPGKATDHTAILQDLLDSGEPIHLGPGRFRVKTLRARKPFALIGTPGATRIESSMTVLEIDAGRAILRDVDFESRSTSNAVVAASGVPVLEITQCSFKGGANGLALDSCAGRVAACRFVDQKLTGLFSQDARGLIVSENEVKASGNNGIQIWRSSIGEDGSQVIGNTVSQIRSDGGGDGQNGNGINVFRAGNVIVANNRISDVAFTGVRNNSGSNCVITGNSISRAGEVALYVEFAFQGAIVSNNLINDVVFGISITNFNDDGRLAVCSGNIVRNASGAASGKARTGGGIFVEADTVVTGNVLENINGHGIELGWSDKLRNLVASNNVIRNAKVGIAVSTVQGVGRAQITDNLIDGAGVAIQGYDYERASTGDLATADAIVPQHMVLRGNTIIERK